MWGVLAPSRRAFFQAFCFFKNSSMAFRTSALTGAKVFSESALSLRHWSSSTKRLFLVFMLPVYIHRHTVSITLFDCQTEEYFTVPTLMVPSRLRTFVLPLDSPGREIGTCPENSFGDLARGVRGMKDQRGYLGELRRALAGFLLFRPSASRFLFRLRLYLRLFLSQSNLLRPSSLQACRAQ